jgi:hypothetical protein
MFSSLVFLLNILFTPIYCNENTVLRLISSTKGELETGNFSHYSLNDRGSFKLVLKSEEGDADLYVSDKYQRVDYSNYDLQSTTYGDDVVYITKDMHRPVFISVYAHPYYFKTRFILYQYEINTNQSKFLHEFNNFHDNSIFDNANDEFKKIDDEKNADQKTYFEHYESYHNQKHQDHPETSDSFSNSNRPLEFEENEIDNGKESILWSIFLHLLEFLAEVLL